MKISVLTICPELFGSFLDGPVIRRASGRGLLSVELVDIRHFAGGSFRRIDDDTYGGGPGMVMRAQPVLDALKDVKRLHGTVRGTGRSVCDPDRKAECRAGLREDGGAAEPAAPPESCLTVALTPCGHVYDQAAARRFARIEHLILICGHYEGIDERVMRHVDEEISVGDYILTGGELPAMTVIDSVVRLLHGVLRLESTQEESFENGLLEYPQYTKPAVLDGFSVPEVLQSGNHEKIERWRLEQSLLRTLRRRPDLLRRRGLTEEERRILLENGLTEEERLILSGCGPAENERIFPDCGLTEEDKAFHRTIPEHGEKNGM